ncbi:MAG: succinylglutamate desuccinylase/aspartoacylase family protein [Bryobacteraceae bacterium]
MTLEKKLAQASRWLYEKLRRLLTLAANRQYAGTCCTFMIPVIHNFADIDFDLPGKHHYQIAFHLDGSWGYSLVPLTVINGKRGPNPNGVICFGGTHGNEYEGQVGLKRLAYDLDAEQIAGRVVLMPQLSESACVASTRTSPLDGVNMNRAFPGNPRGTVSSRIANFVKTRIFPLGRIVIDIHSGGMEGAFPYCTSFHPIPDLKQRAEIATVSRLFDTGFALIYSSAMASGLLTDEAEAEGKVTIGSELGAGASTDRQGVRHAYEGTKNVLRHYGLLEGEIVKIRPEGSEPTRLIKADKLDAYVPAPANGVWEPVVATGQAVNEGELLGRLHDFSDHSSAAREILAPRAGWVAMLHLGARPQKGQTLFVIAENVDWSEVLG